MTLVFLPFTKTFWPSEVAFGKGEPQRYVILKE